ncbi:MAG: TlpA family protein disulfide reductase [Phreatobacter sp.]
MPAAGFGGLAAILAVAALTRPVAAAPPRNFLLHETPKPVPEIHFVDGDGRSSTLAEFRGKALLLNVWATWCLPCRKEMPALDRLQAELGGPDFMVVALSIDRAGAEAVRKFYAEVGITRLAIAVDSSARALRDLGIFGIPVTLLVDRDGSELGRLIGPAEWDSPEMLAFLREQIKRTRAGALPADHQMTSDRRAPD